MKLDQLGSIVVYGLIALWPAVPRLRKVGRADALIALLWVHVFRYSVLYLFKAQREGYAISDSFPAKQLAGSGNSWRSFMRPTGPSSSESTIPS